MLVVLSRPPQVSSVTAGTHNSGIMADDSQTSAQNDDSGMASGGDVRSPFPPASFAACSRRLTRHRTAADRLRPAACVPLLLLAVHSEPQLPATRERGWGRHPHLLGANGEVSETPF